MAESNFEEDLVSEYINVSDVETHVIKYGNIRSPESRQKEQQYLFLLIPGTYQAEQVCGFLFCFLQLQKRKGPLSLKRSYSFISLV